MLLYQVNMLGPLLITLGRMLSDIGLFAIIACALIFAFTGAFQSVYQHQVGSFKKFGQTVKFCVMMFFGDWGEVEELVYQPEPVVGPLLFITLLVLGTVVQLNLLIAMLTSTYEETKANAAKEWRLSRSLIVLEFTDQVRSVGDLPLLNIARLALFPLTLLFPSVWAKEEETEETTKAVIDSLTGSATQ